MGGAWPKVTQQSGTSDAQAGNVHYSPSKTLQEMVSSLPSPVLSTGTPEAGNAAPARGEPQAWESCDYIPGQSEGGAQGEPDPACR